MFHSSQTPPTGSTAPTTQNPEVDALIDRATAALTETERRTYYAAAQRIVAHELPVISLWTRANVAVAQDDLDGIELSPVGDLDFLRNVSRRR